MVHHPMILVPKLVVLLIIIIVLVVLHGVLTREQFRVAVGISAVVFVCAVVAIWVIGYRLLKNPESRVAKATILSSEQRAEDGYTAPSPGQDLVTGSRGKTVTGLRPSGIALIDGRRVSVTTYGEFIQAGAEVEVAAMMGARVVVRESEAREVDA